MTKSRHESDKLHNEINNEEKEVINVFFHPLVLIKLEISNARKVSVFEVFLVRFFPHSDWIWRDTEDLPVFNPDAGKYVPEKLRIQTLFTQCPISYPLETGCKLSVNKT